RGTITAGDGEAERCNTPCSVFSHNGKADDADLLFCHVVRSFLFDLSTLVYRWLIQFKNTTKACVDSNDRIDRKSTRLNSSHVSISYAVFCLKKKKKKKK